MKKYGNLIIAFLVVIICSCLVINKAITINDDVNIVSDIVTSTQESITTQVTNSVSETNSVTTTTASQKTTSATTNTANNYTQYYFRSNDLYTSHYEKHKNEFGDITKQEYLQKANNLLNSNSNNILTKNENDGDALYYNKDTNEFIVLSTDGYIRTYFKPDDGIDYYNRQ